MRRSRSIPFLVGVVSLVVATADRAGATPCGQFSQEASPTRGHSQVFLDVQAVPATSTAWAVGTFHDNAVFADQTLIERWDGTAWAQVPSPSLGKRSADDNVLRGVDATGPDDGWAVGDRETVDAQLTLALHWNGSRWMVVRTPRVAQYSHLSSVASRSPADAWAVGHFFDSTHDPVRQETLTMHWDGESWAVVPSPNVTQRSDNELVSVDDIPGTNQAVAVGYHQWERPRALIEWWDGTAWTVMPTPITAQGGEYLNAVSALAADDVWAVGFSIDRFGAFQGLTLHWDGVAWNVVRPAPPPGDGYDPMPTAVSALSPDDVWLVGSYYNGNAAALTLAEHWDGTRWTVQPSFNPGGESDYAANVLYGVAALTPTDVRAVGYWHAPGFDPDHALIEAWCP